MWIAYGWDALLEQVLEKLGFRLFRARSRSETMFFVLVAADQVSNRIDRCPRH